MEDLRDQGFPRYQLERLNACRMYLEVTTLAEITDHTGVELLPQILSSPTKPTPTGLNNILAALAKDCDGVGLEGRETGTGGELGEPGFLLVVVMAAALNYFQLSCLRYDIIGN